MPTYDFLNKNTNEIETHVMKISELDNFKENNPHLERYIGEAPILGDGVRMNVPGVGQPRMDFERGVIQRIKEKVPGNNLHRTHKTKLPREW